MCVDEVSLTSQPTPSKQCVSKLHAFHYYEACIAALNCAKL